MATEDDRNGAVADKDDATETKSVKQSTDISDSGVSEADAKPRAKSRRKSRGSSESSDDEKHARRRRKTSSSRKRKSRRRHSSSDDESESESDEESSEESESVSEDESERRRRRRKRKEKEEELRRREKKRRRREKEEKEKKKRKKKKEKKEKGKKGAVTDSWGKYGIIRETDMWSKRPEFTAWLSEVKQVNLEHLPNWEEKQMFKQFMEDHNTATFPSKKYYSLDAYYSRKMEKEMKKGMKKVVETERTVFNDEEVRKQEMMQVRERQKEEEVEALKRSMQSGLAKAMKEQAQLREEMAYQYKIGNFEAAAAIQRRLDPDAE